MGRSGGNKRALVDAGNRLVVNYGTDYADGVDVRKLHLAEHVKTGFWEATEYPSWQPPRNQWTPFFELDTDLPSREWDFVTFCEIGMLDLGTVRNFWWGTWNQSHVNGQGNIVIKWDINIYDTGTDWMPWSRKVFWLAFRR